MNKALEDLYKKYEAPFLEAWQKAFRSAVRMNRFGVIDETHYRKILFIGKETRGWGFLLLDWLQGWLRGTEAGTQHPRIWYNVSRWAKFIADPTTDKAVLAAERSIDGLRYIAFTNVNKVGGFSSSGKAFEELAQSAVARELLKEELKILKPEWIVLCGTDRGILPEGVSAKVLQMPHPSARRSALSLLEELEEKLDGNREKQD